MDLFGNALVYLSRSPYAGVLFPTSTESLEAIMRGLDPNSEDTILAVGGCGDQAFALLEKAGRVVVTDVNQSQLELIRKRKEALAAEDYIKFFLGTGSDFEFFNSDYRVKYFSDKTRIDLIRQNLQNLEIGHARSIEEHTSTATFSKIYASDAISQRHSNIDMRSHLRLVLIGLRKHGLLYIANGDEINRLVPNILSLGIQVEHELTGRAQAAEALYRPTVYKKI